MVDLDLATQDDLTEVEGSITTVGRNINNLTQEVARTQFEVGLSELQYETGFYDPIIDSSKFAELVDVEVDTETLVLLPPPDSMFETDESPFSVHTNRITFVSVPSDSDFGYSGSADETVRKWDTATMTEASESPFGGHPEGVGAGVVPSGGDFGYTSGSFGDPVRKWDTATMTEVSESPFDGHGGSRARSLFVNPDTATGFSGGADETVRKWDTATMTEASESPFGGHNAQVYSVTADTTSGFGYSGDSFDAYVVRKWDTATMTEASESPFGGHTDTVNSISIDPDTGFGYSASGDGTVRKWDTATMTEASESPFSASNANVNGVSVQAGSNVGYSGGAIPPDVQKWVNSPEGETDGNAKTPFKDLGIIPDRLVIGQSATVPANTTLSYKIEDDQGNVETFTQSEVDTEVQLPSISSSTIRATIVLGRDTPDDPTPELNSYAVYLSE